MWIRESSLSLSSGKAGRGCWEELHQLRTTEPKLTLPPSLPPFLLSSTSSLKTPLSSLNTTSYPFNLQHYKPSSSPVSLSVFRARIRSVQFLLRRSTLRYPALELIFLPPFTSFQISIITLDFSTSPRLPFHLKRKPVLQALRLGVVVSFPTACFLPDSLSRSSSTSSPSRRASSLSVRNSLLPSPPISNCLLLYSTLPSSSNHARNRSGPREDHSREGNHHQLGRRGRLGNAER